MKRALLLAAALALPAYAMADTMQPGLYRTHTESPGEKPENGEQCITQKDIDEGLSGMGADKDESCKVQDLKRTSSSASYRSACSGNGMNVTMQANINFASDSFDMNLVMTVGKETTKIHMTGKRIGPCSEGSKRRK